MQKFGEMCIATYRDNTHQAKLANQGNPSILVGYAEGHPTGTYQVFNPKTKQVILTRDMTFLQKSYGECSKVEKPALVSMSCEGLDYDKEFETVPIISNNNKSNEGYDSNSVNDIESDNETKILMMKS